MSSTRTRSIASPAWVLALVALVILSPLFCVVVDASSGGSVQLDGPSVDESAALHAAPRWVQDTAASRAEALAVVDVAGGHPCEVEVSMLPPSRTSESLVVRAPRASESRRF